jgi:hypothetical protein
VVFRERPDLAADFAPRAVGFTGFSAGIAGDLAAFSAAFAAWRRAAAIDE